MPAFTNEIMTIKQKSNQTVEEPKIIISMASAEHHPYAADICELIAQSATSRGTGIAQREPAYIKEKMTEGKAVIALTEKGNLAGFCYIESWGKQKKFVANSGLIVTLEYRKIGLGWMIKKSIFKLSQIKYPDASIFGITTNPAVMKINYNLGYRPVNFEALTDDKAFWKGCDGCNNYDILVRTKHQHCLCTAMLYDPKEKVNDK